MRMITKVFTETLELSLKKPEQQVVVHLFLHLSLALTVTTSLYNLVFTKELANKDSLSHPLVPPMSEQVFMTLHSEFGHWQRAIQVHF